MTWITISACACNEHGSVDDFCNENGVCSCKENYGGEKCDQCVEGFFGFPECQGIICLISFKI